MKKSYSGIIWGISFLVIGINMFGNYTGLFSFDLFFNGWWTLFLILPAIASLIFDKYKMSNAFIFTLGVILLLNCQGFIVENMFFKILLSCMVILFGINFIFTNISRNKKS